MVEQLYVGKEVLKDIVNKETIKLKDFNISEYLNYNMRTIDYDCDDGNCSD